MPKAPPARLRALADPEARAAYSTLLERSPHASPWAGLTFADAICEAFGLRGGLVLAGEDPLSPEAGCLVFEKRRGPFRIDALPPLAEYAGPLLGRPLDEARVHTQSTALDSLLALVGRGFHQATWRLHPGLTDVRPLQWAGWRVRPAYQYWAPLGGEASAEGSYESSAEPSALGAWGKYARRTLRRHAEAYAVEEIRAARPVTDLAALSLQRKGLAPLDPALQALVADALMASGEARAWIAQGPEGEIEAGVVATLCGETATYWIVGGRPGPATTVVAAHLAEAAREAGCTHLCLGGANVPSVAEFKRGLGGRLMPFYVARWARGPLRLRDALAGA